jgi:hypothetical protein
MQFILALLFLFTSNSYSEIGNVIKVLDDGGYILRNGEKIALKVDFPIELQDEIFTNNSVLLIQIDPSTQVSLSRNSHLKLSEHQVQDLAKIEKAFSVIELIQGLIRVNVDKDQGQEIDQKVKTRDVVFGISATDFEITIDQSQDVELDVFDGQVEVSSPYVHSFVPEIVRSQEGLIFQYSKKSFLRRKFRSRFKNHPGFERPEVVRRKWKDKKLKRKAKLKRLQKIRFPKERKR